MNHLADFLFLSIGSKGDGQTKCFGMPLRARQNARSPEGSAPSNHRNCERYLALPAPFTWHLMPLLGQRTTRPVRVNQAIHPERQLPNALVPGKVDLAAFPLPSYSFRKVTQVPSLSQQSSSKGRTLYSATRANPK